MPQGLADQPIWETPIAVLDFETTGLTPGVDRVVEVSVMRIDPGKEPELVFDTLVNPQRTVAATEIHGITDGDVADAPTFAEIAGDFVKALSGSMVAAYNVYFDMRFLEYELGRAGRTDSPPHMCLMYLRPMLDLGSRCRLGAACKAYGVPFDETHIAADDVRASVQLLQVYRKEIDRRGIRTFRDLGRYRRQKSLPHVGLCWLSGGRRGERRC